MAIPLILLCTSMGSAQPPRISAPAPQVGFSFSPLAAQTLGLDPQQALTSLLDRLDPDIIRLPITWYDVAATRDRLDFTVVDSLVKTVSAHNQHVYRQTHIAMVVGGRNIGYPEFYAPSWLATKAQNDIPQLLTTPEYQGYFRGAISRYAHNPLLSAWQVENEPLDDVHSLLPGSVAIPTTTVAAEIAQVHSIDPVHPVIVTTYNSSTVDLDKVHGSPFGALYAQLRAPQAAGHPDVALSLSDVLGLDLYVVTPNTHATGMDIHNRIQWKEDGLPYWGKRAVQADKKLWITEMQAAPWLDNTSFQPNDLFQSASEYSDWGASVILLWGVEGWLKNPQWMSAGTTSVHILRGEAPQQGTD